MWFPCSAVIASVRLERRPLHKIWYRGELWVSYSYWEQVFLCSLLSFKDHIAQQTAKANKIVGLIVIRRSFDHLSEKMFVILYKSLVRPILEYGHSIWQPSEKGLCCDIEKVQKRAIKMLGHLKDKPYCERLKKLKLPSLEFRRLRGDMIETYKFLHGHYDTEHPKFEKPASDGGFGLNPGFFGLNP